MAGRACERKAKPGSGGVQPQAAGRSPVGALMVGAGRAGRSPVVIREPRRGPAGFMAPWPAALPGGSHLPAGRQGASVVAGKRVTTACLCRTADRWSQGTQESGCAMNPNDDAKSAAVAATPKQAEEARAPWGWGGTYGLDRAQVDVAHRR